MAIQGSGRGQSLARALADDRPLALGKGSEKVQRGAA
jgi:hypothetical protein